ncbi:hypothetical protein Pst134EA_000919 [Puccinia striiformis f. sp. tritici]|uniref:hypothetical protein n=1 Tax=Puccinia striiformis f. sp. tritici TaxID=168172 RepID=UPI002007F4AC|nr:hypothetical protein Pst134EA_000919 [Puccinia striiformis f. sp. tritici]KAH9473857.1 hypothetical protein Pst134EA_000919 [Puccinia striiformis f. sp. tritici]
MEEGSALKKNSLIELSSQNIKISETRPETEKQEKLVQNLIRIQNSLKAFKASLSSQETPPAKLFPLLKQSTIQLNSLIQSQSFIEQLNQQHQTNSIKRSSYLDPTLLIQNSPNDHQRSLLLIEALANEIGLESFRDTEDTNLLTIAGKLFVIDIEIDPDPSSLNQRVTRSKFSYSFGEEESKRDTLIDHELTLQLSNLHLPFQDHPPHSYCNLNQLDLVQNSLIQFSQSLKLIKNLDECMVSNNSTIDYFYIFRQLISNYHSTYFNTTQSSKDPVKLSACGYPITRNDQLKLDLIYHVNATELIKHASTNPDHKTGLKISISLTPLTSTKPLNPAGNGLFTATFDPPLPVCKHTITALSNVSIVDLDTFFNNHTVNDTSLEDLLVSSSSLNITNLSDWKSKRFGKTLESRKFMNRKISQVYSLLDGEEYDQGEGEVNSRLGFMIDHLRFDDINSLLKIIRICQRQSIYNELFNSCFNKDCLISTKNRRNSNNDQEIRIGDLNLNNHDRKQMDEVDPFIGFNSCDYFQSLSENQSKEDHPSSIKRNHDLKQQEEEEISIDLIMNHSDYSITLQFISPSSLSSSSANPTGAKRSSPSPSPKSMAPIREDNDGEEEDEFKVISLTFTVTESGSIRLLTHSLFDDDLPTPVDNDTIIPSPAHHDHSGTHLSSDQLLKITNLEHCIDRVHCLPVLLNYFFAHYL